MATEKQIAANRANALQSTGPKTEAGKAASSQNAVKHNLTSQYLIIIPGQEDAFAELESGLRAKLIPNGPLEEVLFKRVAECAWNLERCRMTEAKVYANSGRPNLDPLRTQDASYVFDRVHRYARESENSMYKAMRELSKLQTEAQFRREICPLTEVQLVDPAQVAGTVHSLSQGCFLSQIMRNVIAFHKAAPKPTPGQALHPLESETRFDATAATPQPLPQEPTVAAAA